MKWVALEMNNTIWNYFEDYKKTEMAQQRLSDKRATIRGCRRPRVASPPVEASLSEPGFDKKRENIK